MELETKCFTLLKRQLKFTLEHLYSSSRAEFSQPASEKARSIPTPVMGFSETLRPSSLAANGDNWITSPELARSDLSFEPERFLGSATHLLANPNLTSSHLFRADILHDTAGILKTPEEKEQEKDIASPNHGCVDKSIAEPLPAPKFDGFSLTRTVLRRFIPRKKLDPELDQTCHFYAKTANATQEGFELASCLLIYLPHFVSEEQVPFYHPAVLALGFLYEYSRPLLNSEAGGKGSLSIHFIPFAQEIPKQIPCRVERTFLALLSAQIRLARSPSATSNPTGGKPRPYKDNILPQHVVQTTYARLKEKYAPSLIKNWVEVTEPSKHVFEDIAIASFLIELWKMMYGVESTEPHENGDCMIPSFPGFVDIACGNGVLVYLLHAEGYEGWGFDARRRKSWATYPSSTQNRLKESLFIPSIFQQGAPTTFEALPENLEVNNGLFKRDTFIISNHADELTIWTPLLGALANSECPSPFLAIPCCSHSISGARFRYPPPKKSSSGKNASSKISDVGHDHDQSPQPCSGDLTALRALKLDERQDPECATSAYAALTAKTMSIAAELGYDVEKTLLRIPSTRNIGIVGGLQSWKKRGHTQEYKNNQSSETAMEEKVRLVVEREAARDGGLKAAAEIWIERSLGLQRGKGSGKLKGGGQHG